MKRYFITATDTDAGKTLITAALLLKAKQHNKRAVAIKPIAAGIDELGSSPDARLLRHYSRPSLALEQHNPLCFQHAIAPHIAAAYAQETLSVERLKTLCQDLLQQPTDLTFIEGAGGWLTPLNQQQTLADLCLSLNAEVIFVVNCRLGCLNHAQLSTLAILNQGAQIAGWISNEAQEPMDHGHENIDYLKHWFAQHQIPHLGHIPFQPNLDPYCEQSLQRVSQLIKEPE